jgi:hypothetical protein
MPELSKHESSSHTAGSRAAGIGHTRSRPRGPDARARTKAGLDPRAATHLLVADCATVGDELAVLPQQGAQGTFGRGAQRAGAPRQQECRYLDPLAADWIWAGLQARLGAGVSFPYRVHGGVTLAAASRRGRYDSSDSRMAGARSRPIRRRKLKCIPRL